MKRGDARIVTPCGADWMAMSPRGKARLCGSCDKLVHDLSSMSEPEARKLLGAPRTEGLCIRYLHDQTGEIWFRDRAPLVPANHLVRRASMAAAAVAVALVPALTEACGGAGPSAAPSGYESRDPGDTRYASPTVGPSIRVEGGAGSEVDGGADTQADGGTDAQADGGTDAQADGAADGGVEAAPPDEDEDASTGTADASID
jgi:hypothetical protein